MKRVVTRERNTTLYRSLHWPIWVWVFFILPGPLARDLFQHGADWRHGVWFSVVVAVTAWRGFAGRLPGVEPQPYVTHWGAEQPNLGYRVVCYTAAWIILLVPFTLLAIGLGIAAVTGVWAIDWLYAWLYYPLALAVVAATFLNWTPRARRSTRNEGRERAWFYIAIWTVAPTQLAAWAAWRLVAAEGISPVELGRLRLAVFILVAGAFFFLGVKNLLPRTSGYVPRESSPSAVSESSD